MLSYLHRLLFAILIVSPFFSAAQVSTSDSLALVDFYNSTKGTTWNRNTNWLTAQPVSAWYGITVAGNRVTSIVLNDNNLRGFLPGSIGNLTGLVTLNVSSNLIKGSLPIAIGKLSSLTGLYISATLMGGAMPTSVGNLSNLVVFEAASNAFSGPLPPSIGKLSKLTRLNLYQNAFSDSIPSSLGNLLQLNTLILSINNFSGSIPSSITNLTNLADFEADFNKLTGSLPSTIGKMTSLQKLVLTQNQLSGAIPASLCKCSNLGVLDLRKNKFSGKLPDSIGRLSSLYWLFLTGNRFSGSLPLSFGQLQNLKMAFLENNQFSGIPDTIRNCTLLNDLRLSHNKLTGTLPLGLAQAPALAFIELNQNGFTGDIPLSYFDNSGISSLLLDNNQLSASQNFNNNFTKQIGTLSVVDNKYNFDGLEFIAQKVFVPYYFYQPPVTIHTRGNKLAVTAGGTLSNNTYTWQNVDTKKTVVIKGDSTFAPAANGRYTVDITNAIAINLTLHSDTFDYKASIAAPVITLSVSPNPARDVIVLSGLPVAGNHVIAITDLSGLVKMQVSSRGVSALRINISSLQKGNYYIKLLDREAVPAGIQFIKQ